MTGQPKSLEEENGKLRQEVAYLRLLVWRLSVVDLAKQHPKYLPWLKITPHVQDMPR